MPSPNKTLPAPLFETYQRFQALNHLNLNAELPAVRDYLQAFPAELRAVDGYQVVRSFLNSYAGNETTFNSYRTHAERLLLWSLLIRRKPILDLTRVDAEAFMEFCLNPPLRWVGPVVKSRFNRIGGRKAQDSDVYQVNEAWRPFNVVAPKRAKVDSGTPCQEKKYTPSQGTVAQIFAVCGSFYQHANDEGFTEANPFRAIKQKSKYKQRNTWEVGSRSLTPLQWDYVIETAERMADADDAHERTLFILATIFSMYLRVSDLVGRDNWEPTMGDFRRNGQGIWFFHVVGKGNKAAKISVRDDYMNTYMARYRRHLGLSPTPAPGERTPLLQALNGRAGLSDRQIRLLIQGVFNQAIERMKHDSWNEAEIDSLRDASLHWLRHTSATFDAPLRDAKDLQADLRHESMRTTLDIYYNSLDDHRASSVKQLPVRRQ
ncbi:tyrosine-type recombinase/integrase [Stutzerimonas decontaminans]|uniref:Integrase n=1 Tax=Stutzerimonas stutzeri TaxID=316 RepID=A0A023WYC1_STUST|nr:site-specific integrase [Stutzerimonas decontaminans]AHY45227.1 integrase [Stutzerimonas decontaminans]